VLTVLSVFGTRPEAIKMAPVIKELCRHPDRIRSVTCSVGQHRQMLDQVLDLFGIVPDYDLNLMRDDQSLSQLTASLFTGLDAVLREVQPDWVLAQGDTTTVFVTAMQAFYQRIPFGHVEAGLRTGDKHRPFPEEVNRRIADIVADVYFAPTARARQALIAEGCAEGDVHVTGNTVIDALHEIAARDYQWESGPLAGIPRDRRLVLITAHRRESFGRPFRELCLAIRELANKFAHDNVHFVYPVHLNPNVRGPVTAILSESSNISLLEPLDYLSLVHLMKRSVLVLTDSGGIQEEAPGLQVPVLVLRETTERPEGLATGLVELVGTDRHSIVAAAERILRAPDHLRSTHSAVSPYGDGKAAGRIVSILLERSGQSTVRTATDGEAACVTVASTLTLHD
jgi:UDP-N-acetylglucosamine 2-epimerase (non-hydrolysing)